MVTMQSSLLFIFCVLLPLIVSNNAIRQITLSAYKSKESHPRQPLIIENDLFSDSDGAEQPKLFSTVPHTQNDRVESKITSLNSSSLILLVYYIGDTVIFLARDPTRSSFVYISQDFGLTIHNITSQFKISDNPSSDYAVIDAVYWHPNKSNFIYFTDNRNKLIFVTKDGGQSFKRTSVYYHPSEIVFLDDCHDFVILDKIDPEKKMYFSSLDDVPIVWDFTLYIKSIFFVSTRESRSKSLIALQTNEESGKNKVLNFGDSSENGGILKGTVESVILDDVEDFSVRGDYMFATKFISCSNTCKGDEKELVLFLSHKNKQFVKAEFEKLKGPCKKFHIADVTQSRIFIAVSHNDTYVNLYVSKIINLKVALFTISLERIMMSYSNSPWRDSWFNEETDEPFTELYKVEGLNGIYIASQVTGPIRSALLGPEHLITKITHDYGFTWSAISRLQNVTRPASIRSSEFAPGIIIATGQTISNLKKHSSLYMSRDAGVSWDAILEGFSVIDIDNHDGILVAVKNYTSNSRTTELFYSLDYGNTWLSLTLSGQFLRVYGVKSKPEKKSTIFMLAGVENSTKNWVVVHVNFKNAFTRDCDENDFERLTPVNPTLKAGQKCLLGKKYTYQRRSATARCYTGLNYDRLVDTEICPCDYMDYECDYGFEKILAVNMDQATVLSCIRNKTTTYDPYKVPAVCPPGTSYNRTKGYVKKYDDVCTGGKSIFYEPDEIPCPIKKFPPFLLVAHYKSIFRINLANYILDEMPVRGLKKATAIEFDMKNNCLYWADYYNNTISRQCFRDRFSNSTGTEILVETNHSSIEGMALDWVSNVLYFVDKYQKRIQIIRTDINTQGRMRTTILGPNNLAHPCRIAVHPKAGYIFWIDWAPGDGSVNRANLDGTNVKRLSHSARRPNGLTIDYISERIYWVDYYEHFIGSSDFDGDRFKRVIRVSLDSQPIAIAVFKDNIYWGDFHKSMIFVADKSHESGVTSIIGHLFQLTDLKVFAHGVQTGTNQCKSNPCPYICLGAPNNTYVCLCPDDMVANATGYCVSWVTAQNQFQKSSPSANVSLLLEEVAV